MLHTLIEPSDFVLKIIGGIHELEGNFTVYAIIHLIYWKR